MKEVRYGGQFRNRKHKLGDIVFSNPVFVGAPSSLNLSPSYLGFAAAPSGRPGTLYVGGNDGMLHAFDAATGNERFAFIPKGVYAISSIWFHRIIMRNIGFSWVVRRFRPTYSSLI